MLRKLLPSCRARPCESSGRWFWNTLTSALLSGPCPGCNGRVDAQMLCRRCWERMELPIGEMPPFPIAAKKLRRCPVERFHSVWWLSDSAKRWLHFVKYRDHVDSLKYVLRRIPQQRLEGEWLIPVPMDDKKRWERGFNQSEWIANWLSRSAGIPVSRALRKVRQTEAQARLGRTERLFNLRRAFEFGGRTVPQSAILVDDVLTTGATTLACARALKSAGVKRIMVWTLFRVR